MCVILSHDTRAPHSVALFDTTIYVEELNVSAFDRISEKKVVKLHFLTRCTLVRDFVRCEWFARN